MYNILVDNPGVTRADLMIHGVMKMITLFNRKVLYQNTDAEATSRVWSALRENGIRYELRTRTHISSFRRMATQHSNMRFNMGGIPASWTDPPREYLYVVYVSRKDYQRARELCELEQ